MPVGICVAGSIVKPPSICSAATIRRAYSCTLRNTPLRLNSFSSNFAFLSLGATNIVVSKLLCDDCEDIELPQRDNSFSVVGGSATGDLYHAPRYRRPGCIGYPSHPGPGSNPDDARLETHRPVDKIATSRGLSFPPTSHMLCMTQWDPPRREPKKTKAEKTKAELREMLAKAVRNTAQPEPKPPPKTKRGRG